MESFYWKDLRKTSNKSAAITEAICQMCYKKWELTESTSSEPFYYFPCQKKLKKPCGQGWMKTKLLELKHLLDQKNCQMKNHPKLRNFSQLWKLANKNHLSSNNFENTNQRHLPHTGTDHCNSRLSENIQF